MFAFVSSSDWISFLTPLLSGTNYSILAICLLIFLRNRNVGHRLLLRIGMIYCVLQAVASYSLAYEAALHTIHFGQWINFVSAVVGFWAILAFLWNFGNVLFTLKESEIADNLRTNTRIDREQAILQLDYVANENRIKSESLMRRSSVQHL